MSDYTLNIRPRRQATFPSALLKRLGLTIGDSLEVRLQKGKAVLIPKKRIALDSLKEIQSVFGQSNISEKSLQDALSKSRGDS